MNIIKAIERGQMQAKRIKQTITVFSQDDRVVFLPTKYAIQSMKDFPETTKIHCRISPKGKVTAAK